MSNNQNVWQPDSQSPDRKYVDATYTQPVYETGMRVPQPPNYPGEHPIAAGNQQFYQRYHGPGDPSHSAAFYSTPHTPRTYPSYWNHPNLPPAPSSPPGVYEHTSGNAGASHMSIPYPTSYGSNSQVNATYGTHAMPATSGPSHLQYDISRNFETMHIGGPPHLPSYRPSVARVRRTSKGDSIMQTYHPTSAMRPSYQERPEIDPAYHGNERSAPLDLDESTASLNTSESPSTLNSNFKKREQSRKFFVTGKVFLTLWAEPAGTSDSSKTVITDGISVGSFNEPVFSKIRRFVVVREGKHACQALPISTYGRQGVSKDGVIKSEHAIIYTGKTPPAPLVAERARRGEIGLLPQPIRVDPDDPKVKLDPISRVDFAKVYTIHHYVKVRSLGRVNRTSMQPLLYQFKSVWLSYLGDTGSFSGVETSQPAHTVKLEASTSSSEPELVAAFNALRACGLTVEQARAPLLGAGFQLSGLDFSEHNLDEDDSNERSEEGEGVAGSFEEVEDGSGMPENVQGRKTSQEFELRRRVFHCT